MKFYIIHVTGLMFLIEYVVNKNSLFIFSIDCFIYDCWVKVMLLLILRSLDDILASGLYKLWMLCIIIKILLTSIWGQIPCKKVWASLVHNINVALITHNFIVKTVQHPSQFLVSVLTTWFSFFKESRSPLSSQNPSDRSVSSQMGCKEMSAFTNFARNMRKQS